MLQKFKSIKKNPNHSKAHTEYMCQSRTTKSSSQPSYPSTHRPLSSPHSRDECPYSSRLHPSRNRVKPCEGGSTQQRRDHLGRRGRTGSPIFAFLDFCHRVRGLDCWHGAIEVLWIVVFFADCFLGCFSWSFWCSFEGVWED